MGSKRIKSKPKTIKVRIQDVKGEPGANELVQSAKMKPYLALLQARIQNNRAATESAVAALANLQIEDRYLWRVVSALKWAFADFDSASIGADMVTMESEDDRGRVAELIQLRPAQFCLLMKAILGSERMEKVLLGAIAHAKESGAFDPVASGIKPLEIKVLGETAPAAVEG